MKYIVIEIQNGVIGGNSWVFEDINAAKSKYHSVLAVAATSSVDIHTAAILNEMGFCVCYEGFDHRPTEEGEPL